MHGLGLLLVLIHAGRRGSWRIVDEDGWRDGRRREVGRGTGRDICMGEKEIKQWPEEEGQKPGRGLSITSRRPDGGDGSARQHQPD